MQLPAIRSQWLSFSFLSVCFAVAVPIAAADEQRLLVTSDDAKIQSGNNVLARVKRETEFTKQEQVGVVAISASSKEFVVEFEDFSITQR